MFQYQLAIELIATRELILEPRQSANPRVLDLEAVNLLSILAKYSLLGSMLSWYAAI